MHPGMQQGVLHCPQYSLCDACGVLRCNALCSATTNNMPPGQHITVTAWYLVAQPERAVEELRHIYTKAKKKASRGKEKKDQQQASVVNTPLRTGLQQQPSVSSLDAAASLPGSRQSPAPESLVVAAAAAGSGHERSTTPAPTPVRVERSASVGMAANLLSQAAGPAGPGPSAAVSGGSLLTQAKKEQEKFSSWLGKPAWLLLLGVWARLQMLVQQQLQDQIHQRSYCRRVFPVICANLAAHLLLGVSGLHVLVCMQAAVLFEPLRCCNVYCSSQPTSAALPGVC